MKRSQKSIVAIQDKNGKNVGCGVYVQSDKPLVITCAHVVTSSLGIAQNTQDKPSELISLYFPLCENREKRDFLKAKVVAWQGVQADFSGDVAVLEILDNIPDDAIPTKLISQDSPWNHQYEVYGYPIDKGQHSKGQIIGQLEGGYVQLEATNTTGYQITKGYSGGGVWSVEAKGVVGIVVAADRDKVARAAFMIPALYKTSYRF